MAAKAIMATLSVASDVGADRNCSPASLHAASIRVWSSTRCNRAGQATEATNFRSDRNLDGFVNGRDTAAVRQGLATSSQIAAQAREFFSQRIKTLLAMKLANERQMPIHQTPRRRISIATPK
jgi:hypothetical protein